MEFQEVKRITLTMREAADYLGISYQDSPLCTQRVIDSWECPKPFYEMEMIN